MHKTRGFTVYELMISVFILALIATSAVVNLRSSRYKDELNTAARVLASDMRSLQNKALTGQNIKTCAGADAIKAVCEDSTSYCQDPATCAAAPAYGVGAHFLPNQNQYTLFADVDQSLNDWKLTDNRELTQTRAFGALGAPNVVINNLFGGAFYDTADVAFQRQNGSMRVNACISGTCSSPGYLRINLRHTVTGLTAAVMVNTATGRVQIF